MVAAPAETQTLVCPVTASQSQSECPVPPGLREQPRPAACSVKKGVAGTAEAGPPSHSTARAAAAGREGAAPQPWPGHALGSLWPWGWHATVAEPPQGRVCPASSGTAARTADPESEAQRRRRARRSAVRPRGAGGRPGLWGTSQGRGVPGHAAAPIRGLFAHV